MAEKKRERPELYGPPPKYFVNGRQQKREPTLSEFGKQSEQKPPKPGIIGSRG